MVRCMNERNSWANNVFWDEVLHYDHVKPTYPHVSWADFWSIACSLFPKAIFLMFISPHKDNQYLCTLFCQKLVLLPETDNCPSWIGEWQENISWSISEKECCQTRRGSNPQSDHQSDTHPTEPLRPAANDADLDQTISKGLDCLRFIYWTS